MVLGGRLWSLGIGTSMRKLVMTEHDQVYLEALVLVMCARVAVAVCFKRVAPWVLRVRDAGAPVAPPELEAQVQMALDSVGKWMPWENLCLPNAIAGKVILARRGYPATVHLGVGHKESGTMRAHAWLEAGGGVLAGGESMDVVTVIPR